LFSIFTAKPKPKNNRVTNKHRPFRLQNRRKTKNHTPIRQPDQTDGRSKTLTHPSVFQVVAWIIVGLVVGAISGRMYTQNQLRRLSKDYHTQPNKKGIILGIVPLLIMLVTEFSVGWFLFDTSMQGSVLIKFFILF